MHIIGLLKKTSFHIINENQLTITSRHHLFLWSAEPEFLVGSDSTQNLLLAKTHFMQQNKKKSCRVVWNFFSMEGPKGKINIFLCKVGELVGGRVCN